MELGTRIKLWREARGLSQRAFAEKLGLTPAAISYWESGATEPKHEHVQLIADALGITLPRFWGDPPKPRRIAKAKRAAA